MNKFLKEGKMLISQLTLSLLEQTGKMSLTKNVLLYCWIELSTEIPEFIPQIFAPSKLEVSSGSNASCYSFSNYQGHRRPNLETIGRGILSTPYLKNVKLGNLMFSKLSTKY